MTARRKAKRRRMKSHLPGVHACYARTVLRSMPDRPAERRAALVAYGFQDGYACPHGGLGREQAAGAVS